MFRILLFLWTFWGINHSVSGQDSRFLSAPPDTMKIYHPADVQFIASLAAIKGKVFDSIDSPKAYFIDTYQLGEGYSWRIAVQKKGGFLVFDPFEASTAYAPASGLKFSCHDLNGKGCAELVINWERYAGHSGFENSVHERNGGMQIWDLDKLNRLLDFENYYNLEQWWTTYSPDPTDTLLFEEREVTDSGSLHECDYFSINLGKKEVSISREENCSEDSTRPALPPPPYLYRLTKNGLIRVK